MIFGLTVEKLLVIGLVAAMILGPERLPKYAGMLAQFVTRAREYVNGAKGRLRDEMGDDVDWRSLDPRQYDPRRIVRQALLEEPTAVAEPSPTLAELDGETDSESPEHPKLRRVA